MTILPLPVDLCPACGGVLRPVVWHQLALLRHGGYGASVRTTRRVCPERGCRWWIESERTEVRP